MNKISEEICFESVKRNVIYKMPIQKSMFFFKFLTLKSLKKIQMSRTDLRKFKILVIDLNRKRWKDWMNCYIQLHFEAKQWKINTDLTAKVLSPTGSAKSFSKSVAHDPTRPMSIPRSLAALPVCEATSGSNSSVMVTSSP
jgi:hypothetical protein